MEIEQAEKIRIIVKWGRALETCPAIADNLLRNFRFAGAKN